MAHDDEERTSLRDRFGKLSKGKLHRILELERQIRRGDYPNTQSFAEDWGGVNPRTIGRDIQYLRYSLDAPIEYDDRRHGYYYSEPDWQLPFLRLKEGELLHLLIARQMSTQFQGTPLEDTLTDLFEKLAWHLPDEISVDPAYVQASISFHGQPAKPIDPDVWTAALHSLRQHRLLEISYQGVNDESPRRRRVEPFHLACLEHEWYLFAYCRSARGERHFALSRIQEARLRDHTYEPIEFDPDTELVGRFGRFVPTEEDVETAVVRFDARTARWIQERQWHPDQTLEEHEDGSVTLSFPMPSVYIVKRWVLQWGGGADVLHPERLREAVYRDVRELAQIYPNGSDASDTT